MPRNPLDRFKKGAIIVHILYHAKCAPFYGSWLKEELERHDYEISYGTLYPWLNSLEKTGYLSVKEKVVEGKIRKYYDITEKGNKELELIKGILKELHEEVIRED